MAERPAAVLGGRWPRAAGTAGVCLYLRYGTKECEPLQEPFSGRLGLTLRAAGLVKCRGLDDVKVGMMPKGYVKRFKTVAQMASAVHSGEIPEGVLSPGGAAHALGVTRQAVYDRIKRGTLRAWWAEGGYVLIDAREVRAAVRRKRGIAEGQGELLHVST